MSKSEYYYLKACPKCSGTLSHSIYDKDGDLNCVNCGLFVKEKDLFGLDPERKIESKKELVGR